MASRHQTSLLWKEARGVDEWTVGLRGLHNGREASMLEEAGKALRVQGFY